MTKEVNSAWWLGLVAGILELVLGFWASQQLFPARGALLLLWVGFFALFRGISEIVIAFEPNLAIRPRMPFRIARLARSGPSFINPFGPGDVKYTCRTRIDALAACRHQSAASPPV